MTGRFTVVIPTLDRPQQLAATLDALDAQPEGDFAVVVVDDSPVVDESLADRERRDGRLTVLRPPGRGLSRARNVGWRSADTEWIVFLDDDALVAPDWERELRRAIDTHPDAWCVSGHIGARSVPEGDYVPVTIRRLDREVVHSGRWTRPWLIGFTVCIAIRRAVLDQLGGFDESLGPGVPNFPSSEDMDLNYRLLRAGGSSYSTPRLRTEHDQWRPLAELAPHYRGYMAGWCGFATKQLRTGDVVGGLWLWSIGVADFLRMLASAVRRRSRVRARVASSKFQGLVAGTAAGLVHRWR